MQNSDFWTRHDLSFCACTTACLASELLVSIGPSPHLWFLDAKQRHLNQNNKSRWVPDITCRFANRDFLIRTTSLYESQTSPAVLCLLKAWLAPEILVSMGPSPHLWFLHAKQQVLDLNYKSLWFPDLACHFVHAQWHNLHQNDKSIWVPALTCRFVHAKQRD